MPWSRATPDTCHANARRERGGMPEPLQVLANLSGSAGKWMHRRSRVRSLKIFEPVALRLRHIAESDRQRQGHIMVVGSPGGTHHNRDGRCSFGFKPRRSTLW